MLQLRITCDGRSWPQPLASAVLSVGRDRSNDVVIPSSSVSKKHATIRKSGRGVIIEDAGSKNRLRVRGRVVSRAELRAGDAVQLGRAIVALEEIPSGDALLALEFRTTLSNDDRGMFVSGETESFIEPHSARGAMRWIRDVDVAGDAAFGQRREFLRSAREILRADAILRVRKTRTGEPIIVEHDGTPLAQSDYDEIMQIERPSRTTARAAWAVTPLRSSFLAIHSASGKFPKADWCREFVEYIAWKFFGQEAVPAIAAPVTSAGLIYPAGYVRGESLVMKSLYDELLEAAASGANVLLRGENGTGKELIARILHDSGPSRDGRFLIKNCAAIPATLLEVELFGIERRIATGVELVRGLFRDANQGTVLLDEIGELPLELQPKLLRVVEQHEIQALGTSVAAKVNVRIISSTNADLEQMVGDGTFRQDLYYRLSSLEFTVPPLRRRREDIPLFVSEFVPRFAGEQRKNVAGVTPNALKALIAYDWPGNVRQLRNVIERAVLRCRSGNAIGIAEIDLLDATPLLHEAALYSAKIDGFKRTVIVHTLEACDGNVSEAARRLGISRPGLYAMLKRLKLRC